MILGKFKAGCKVNEEGTLTIWQTINKAGNWYVRATSNTIKAFNGIVDIDSDKLVMCNHTKDGSYHVDWIKYAE